MPLHLIKLCVGCESPEDLAAWQQQRLQQQGRVTHVTRMVPKRADELVDGGSLYWVIKGWVRVRQRLLAAETIRDAEGRNCCVLVLDPPLITVESRAHRPFQGWRYLTAGDAPRDILTGNDAEGSLPLPDDIAAELRQMGFI